MRVLGRRYEAGPTARLGRYRAWDGSDGDRVALDLDGPHAVAVVGKRGSGKSYTLGVLAEELQATEGVVPVVLDPMSAIGDLPGTDRAPPLVRADAIPPPAWPALLGLDAAGPAGALVWRAAAEAGTLDGIREFVAGAEADRPARRAAANHLGLAAAWDVFDPDGLAARDLLDGATVVDLSGLAAAPTNAVARAVADTLYRSSHDRTGPLPWLVVDEAHVLFEGVARPAIERLLTRGRQPGVSLVLATQRPAALPDVAVSQADVILAHRLTGEADRERLVAARPAYLTESLSTRLPERPGEALVVDDATEEVHPVTVRERHLAHPGDSPRVRDRVAADGAPTD